jgi:hypothetical protein
MKIIIILSICLLVMVASFFQRRQTAKKIAEAKDLESLVKSIAEDEGRNKGAFDVSADLLPDNISWRDELPDLNTKPRPLVGVIWRRKDDTISYHVVRSWLDEKGKISQQRSHILETQLVTENKTEAATGTAADSGTAVAKVPSLPLRRRLSQLVSDRAARIDAWVSKGVGAFRTWYFAPPPPPNPDDEVLLGSKSLIRALATRTENLKSDLYWLAAGLALLGLITIAVQAMNGSGLLVGILTTFTTTFIGCMLLSILMRLISRRRMAPPIRLAAGAAVLAPFAHFISSFVSFLYSNTLTQSPGFNPTAFLFSVMSVFVTALLACVVASRLNLSRAQIRSIAAALGGMFLCDVLFLFALGPAKQARFSSEAFGLIGGLGYIATLIVAVIVLLFYLPQRKQPSSWIIFAVGGLVAGLSLRLFVVFQEETRSLLQLFTTTYDFIWVGIIGGLAGSAALLAKRVYADRDPVARLRAVRVRGGLLIIYAVMPVVILVLIVSAFSSFLNSVQIETVGIESRIIGLRHDAERAARHVNAFRGRMDENLDRVISLADEVQADVRATAEQIQNELERNAEVATGLAGKLADKATSELEAVGKEITAAIDNVIKLPDIPTPFGDIELPDLGIGKAIKGLFSKLIPDFNIEDLFAEFVAGMSAEIEAELAEPIARAKAIKANIENLAEARRIQVIDLMEKAGTDFDTLVSGLEAEKERAYANMRGTIVHIVNIGYHLLVFLLLLSLGVTGLLAWKAINALVVMAGRIESGWHMMMSGKDPDLDENLVGPPTIEGTLIDPTANDLAIVPK